MEQLAPTVKKKVHVETWGCQMNVADSEKMVSLISKDYELSSEPDCADLIILNSCHIREKARHKVVSRLGVLKEFKKTNPSLIIALTGCVAQAEGKKLLKQAPTIDLLLGPGKLRELPGLIEEFQKNKKQLMALGFGTRPKTSEEPPKVSEPSSSQSCQKAGQGKDLVLHGYNPVSRYVNIQQGCDNFCTFCVVPFTRGREISETPDHIYKRASELVQGGAREITLLGQNVNSYGLDLVSKSQLKPTDNGPFVDLIKKVATIDGLESLRFTTSNPHDLTKPLADLYDGSLPVCGNYFHLPVQSGSNKVLKVMRRKVTREEYLEKVRWLRAASPDMAISTDIIVGFPGETEEDFQETLELVKEVNFAFAYAFKYSPRKGTAAQRFRNQVPEEVKTKRLARLNQLLNEQTLAHHHKEVGKTHSVLFCYESPKEKNLFFGRTPSYHLVRAFSKDHIAGQKLSVKIIEANKTGLLGELL